MIVSAVYLSIIGFDLLSYVLILCFNNIIRHGIQHNSNSNVFSHHLCTIVFYLDLIVFVVYPAII